jgi:hypothetical protein
MKLIDQVITLSQAKRLKELGIRQDASHAAWLRNECHKETEFWCWPVEAQGITNRGYSSPAKGCLEGFSAFTVAELGVMLGTEEWSTNYKKQNIFYWEAELFAFPFGAYPTEAEARAELLLHLIEGNYITVEEVNARLCA